MFQRIQYFNAFMLHCSSMFNASISGCLYSTPECFIVSIDYCLNGSTPQRLNGSMAQHLKGSTPQWLNGSKAQRLNITTFQWLNSSSPQRLNGSPAQRLIGSMLNGSRLNVSTAQLLPINASMFKWKWLNDSTTKFSNSSTFQLINNPTV
jgi:hypothetical protein